MFCISTEGNSKAEQVIRSSERNKDKEKATYFPDPFKITSKVLKSQIIKSAGTFYRTFKEDYDTAKPEAARDAMIRASIKTGLAYCLPRHWITGVVMAVGPLAKRAEPYVGRLKCPLEDEIFYSMHMMPSCRESKTALLAGLKFAKAPGKLFDETSKLISEYTVHQANKYGITEENIKDIAKVAHRIIFQTIPEKLIELYKDWATSPPPYFPISASFTLPQPSPQDLERFNDHLMQYLHARDREGDRHLNALRAHVTRGSNNNAVVLEHLQEVKSFFEMIRIQEKKREDEENWNRMAEIWSNSFSNLSQAGANLGAPILCDIASFGHAALSGTTALQTLSSLGPTAGAMATAVPVIGLACAALSVITLFCREENETDNGFNRMVMDYLETISHQVENVRREMHGRFDHVDRQLEAILKTLETGINVLNKNLNNLAVPVLVSLHQIRTAIETLYRTSNSRLDESLLREFEDAVDKVDNFINGIIPHEAMKEMDFFSTARILEKVILKQSSSPSSNESVYRDFSAEGVNRLLASKEVGHVLGYLGEYATYALNIQFPQTIQVQRISNPHIWSVALDRYLKLRKSCSSFNYDEQGIMMKEILKSGEMIINFTDFMSKNFSIWQKYFDNYTNAVQNFENFINEQCNVKIEKILGDCGFETQQKDFTQRPILTHMNCSHSLDRLRDQKAVALTDSSNPLPLDWLLKHVKIPMEFLLAESLGIGKIHFTHSFSKRVLGTRPGTYPQNYWEIVCSFSLTDINRSIPLVATNPSDTVNRSFTLFTTNIADGPPSYRPYLKAPNTTWSQGIVSPQVDASDLHATKVQIYGKIQEKLVELRKDFARSLLESGTNELTTRFNLLMSEIDAQTNLLHAHGLLTGFGQHLSSHFEKLWTKQKMHEVIQNYMTPGLQTKFIHSNLLSDFYFLKQEITRLCGPLSRFLITNGEELNAILASETHPFLPQVKKQYQALQNFSDIYLQQRALLSTMDNRELDNDIGFEETEIQEMGEPKEPVTRDINRNDKAVKKLKNQLKELKNQMTVLTQQNNQILQLLMEQKQRNPQQE